MLKHAGFFEERCPDWKTPIDVMLKWRDCKQTYPREESRGVRYRRARQRFSRRR